MEFLDTAKSNIENWIEIFDTVYVANAQWLFIDQHGSRGNSL